MLIGLKKKRSHFLVGLLNNFKLLKIQTKMIYYASILFNHINLD